MNHKISTINGKRYITFPMLTDLGLANVFSTKDMDFRLRDNMDKEEVLHNYNLLKTVIKSPQKLMFTSNQVHDCNIITVNSLDQGEIYEYGKTLPPVDGLISNNKNLILKTTYADCTPLLIFDPISQSQASLHSGWRGTTKKIGELGVKRLEVEFGAKPENMVAVIGPALGKNSFEVEKDVVEIFKSNFDFWEEVISSKNETKYLIDIKKTNELILINAGLKKDNIFICSLDTYNNELFHSHRYDGEAKAGRMVMLSSIE